ncbi:hypothetical protein [Nannocystis pusilla]|uniref:hypothetical protein n=1 Tax=Nannocystis pusilla TaxID=889268 RepID=UPI003DA45496
MALEGAADGVGGLGEGGDRQRRLEAVEAVEDRGLGGGRELRDDAVHGVAHGRDRAGVGEGGDDVDAAVDAAGVEPPDRGEPGQGVLQRGGDVDLELAGGEVGGGDADADLHRRGRRRELGPGRRGRGGAGGEGEDDREDRAEATGPSRHVHAVSLRRPRR